MQICVLMMETFMDVQTVPCLVLLHTDITVEADSLQVCLHMVPHVLLDGAPLPAHQAHQLSAPRAADQGVDLGIQGVV